jgi:hypothetical protein
MLTLTLVLKASFLMTAAGEETKEGGKHNNQPIEGRAAKISATEETQQATTSQRHERTKGWHNNHDAVERHVCSEVVQ